MMTRVKICGITRLEDAELAVELGASALGFNFYRASPRYIAPEAARQIIVRAVPPPVMAVGVFADETSPQHVLTLVQEAGVSAIQLHGPQLPISDNGFRRRYPLIRAVVVDDKFDAAPLRDVAQEESGVIMLDAFHPVLRGGTGQTIDWAKAREAAKLVRVILAGGLTPENVGEAIRQVRPFAVDVASGVEAGPGVKDASKLRAFFNAVREVDSTTAPSWVRNEQKWLKDRRRLRALAWRIIQGKESVIEGSCKMMQYRFWMREEQDESFDIFAQVQAKSRDLPVGSVRQYWAADSLREKDKEIKRVEDLYRERVIQSAVSVHKKYDTYLNESRLPRREARDLHT